MGKRRVIPLAIIALLLPLLLSPDPSVALYNQPSDLNVGPYVDEIIYRVMLNQDARILALLAGEIQLDNEVYDPSSLVYFEDPDIGVFEALRNGYVHISINCDKYPLNISGLRRAFAFAFDKRAVQQDIMAGCSQLHDSLVPATNNFSIEDTLEWHYYDADPITGNQILDDLGFNINATTGFRQAPNGHVFHIKILYVSSGIHEGVAQLAVSALESLHIDATAISPEYNLNEPEDYDMLCWGSNFKDYDVAWLGDEFWSGNADDPFLNLCNFRNDTFDSWRDQLLHSVTYEEVYEAASEMQKILHYNVPRLVACENIYLQLYRTDVFTGHVPDVSCYLSGPWTMRKMHRIDGTLGGTVPIGTSGRGQLYLMDSFNIFISNSSYSAAIFSELWPSLYSYAPDMSPYPYLAQHMITETHADNPSVPDGHMRFTFDIIQNATWSDGTPLTAADIAFTYNYMLESGEYGNPAAADLSGLFGVYSPNPHRVILEFSTESYWHFSRFAFDYIIPKHIFNNETGIGYAGWNTWNPVFDPAEPHVTAGPFIPTNFETPWYYTLRANQHFAFYPEVPPPPDYIVTNPDTNTSTGTNSEPLNPITLASIAIAGGSTVVIIMMVVLIIQHKQVK